LGAKKNRKMVIASAGHFVFYCPHVTEKQTLRNHFRPADSAPPGARAIADCGHGH
jgi:hypothetical protein